MVIVSFRDVGCDRMHWIEMMADLSPDNLVASIRRVGALRSFDIAFELNDNETAGRILGAHAHPVGTFRIELEKR
jgi:hypothetical protein